MSENDNVSKKLTKFELELHFLIIKYLASGPFGAVAKTLIKELEKNELVPRRFDWNGIERPQTFQEWIVNFQDVPQKQLLDLCLQLGPLAKQAIPQTLNLPASLLNSGRCSLLRTKKSIAHTHWGLNDFLASSSSTAPSAPPHNLKTSNWLIPIVAREYNGSKYQPALSQPQALYQKITLLRRILGHLSSVYCVMFDRTGSRIFTGSDDSLIKCWQVTNGRLLCTYRGHQSEICDMDICHENIILASASCNKVIRIWDARNASPIAILQGHSAMITSIEFSPVMEGDTRYLVSTGRDGNVCFWTYGAETMEFNRIPTKFEERNRPGVAMLCCSCSKGGRFVTVGGSDNLVHVYHIPQENKSGYIGPSIHGEFSDHTDNVDSLWFSNSGLRFVSGSRDGTAKIWTYAYSTWQPLSLDVSRSALGLPSSESLNTSENESQAESRTSSNNSNKLKVTMVAWDCVDVNVFTALTDFTIKVWNSTNAGLLNILKGHTNEAYCLTGHPKDRQILLSAGHDGNVMLWNILSGEVIMKFHNMLEGQGHGAVFDAHFSPDGSIFACTDSHGHLLLFGTGNKQAYDKVPTEQFFHTDYRPLMRDSNGYVLDEQTQQAPHLMPPPFLVDMEGNPHLAEYQRLVPGRERLKCDLLVPTIAVGENGQQEVLGDSVDMNSLSNSNGQSTSGETSNITQSSREDHEAASILDEMINQMQRENDQGRGAAGPSSYNLPHSPLASPTRTAPVGLQREGEVAGVRQMHENAPRSQVASAAELADLIKRIIVPQLTKAQIEQNHKLRIRQSLHELDWLKRERRRRLHSSHKKTKEVKQKVVHKVNRKMVNGTNTIIEEEESDEENAREIFRNHRKKARRCRMRLHQHGYSTRSSAPVGYELRASQSMDTDSARDEETSLLDIEEEMTDTNSSSSGASSSTDASSEDETMPNGRSPRTLRQRTRRNLRSNNNHRNSSMSHSSPEETSSQEFQRTDLVKKRRDKRKLQRLTSTTLTPSKRPQRKATKRFYETLKSEESGDSDVAVDGNTSDQSNHKVMIKSDVQGTNEQPTSSRPRRIQRKKKKQTIVKKKLPFEMCEGDTLPSEYFPPDWIINMKPRPVPYVPQIGDEVVYMKQGHESYVSAVESCKAWNINPDEVCYKTNNLSATETCNVIDVQYETGPPTLCQITLRPTMRKSSSNKENSDHDFTFKYHDMTAVIDFIVLKQKLQWKAGDRFRSVIDNRWWYGSIVEKQAINEEYPQSPFQSLVVAWDSEVDFDGKCHATSQSARPRETERMSPWDLEQIPSSSGQPRGVQEGDDVTEDDIREVMHYTPTQNDWNLHIAERFIDDSDSEDDMNDRIMQHMNNHCERIANAIRALITEELYQPFSAPVSLYLYPAYAISVAYPTDLTTILERLNNRFYRRLDAICWEVQLLEINARSFNEPHSTIVRIGKLLTNLLLEFIRDESNSDILRLHRSLHIKRRVEQSSTSEEDSNHDAEFDIHKVQDKISSKRRKANVSTQEHEPPVPVDLDFWKQKCEELLDFVWSVNDAKPFRHKVDISVYPDYMDYVTQPICLDDIRRNLHNTMYDAPKDLYKDIELIFANSRAYNTDKRSQICSMTIRLQALVESRFKPILQEYEDAVKLIHSQKKSQRRLRRSSRRRRRIRTFIDDEDKLISSEDEIIDPSSSAQLTNGNSLRSTRSSTRNSQSIETIEQRVVAKEEIHEEDTTTSDKLPLTRSTRKTRLTRYHESDDEIIQPPKKRLSARIICSQPVPIAKSDSNSEDEDGEPVFESRRSTRKLSKNPRHKSDVVQRSSRARNHVVYQEYDSSENDSNDESPDLGMSRSGRRRRMSVKAKEGRVF